VPAKLISLAALPIHGAGFQCQLAGFENTGDEGKDLIQKAMQTLGRYLVVLNSLEQVSVLGANKARIAPLCYMQQA
jgi:hypothetical protein